LQLLRYVVRVLVRWYEQNGKRLPLPSVLPLLAHQGPEGWTHPCEFVDLFGPVSESLRPYLPSFRHALVDLGPMDDHALSADVRLRAFLSALKYRRRPDLDDRVGLVLADAPALKLEDLLVILKYLDPGLTARSLKAVHEALDRLGPERKERILGPLSQPYYEKGLAEGEAKGIARGETKGEAKGEAKILALLLERRFGALPLQFRQRIFAADVGVIEDWVRRALDAPDLESVFQTN